MIHLYVFGGLALFVLLCVAADYARLPYHKRVRQFPKGHVHEYEPTGEYTYKHQNPILEGGEV